MTNGELPPEVVRVDDVTVRRGGLALLDGVHWTVRRGECWAVLGPNGAGKSCLLGLLTGHLWATSGTIEVLGQRLGRTDVRELRRRVPLVSHRLADQLRDGVSVHDLLRAARRGALAPGLEERRRALATSDLAERVQVRTSVSGDARGTEEGGPASVAQVAAVLGLGGLMERRWGRCSQGERQRVLLARALLGIGHAGAPGLLLLDEATSGLDLPGRELLLELVERGPSLPAVQVAATVVVAHHLEDLPASTTHALLLRDGRVEAAGDAGAVLGGDALARTFGIAVRAERRGDGRFGAVLEG